MDNLPYSCCSSKTVGDFDNKSWYAYYSTSLHTLDIATYPHTTITNDVYEVIPPKAL